MNHRDGRHSAPQSKQHDRIEPNINSDLPLGPFFRLGFVSVIKQRPVLPLNRVYHLFTAAAETTEDARERALCASGEEPIGAELMELTAAGCLSCLVPRSSRERRTCWRRWRWPGTARAPGWRPEAWATRPCPRWAGRRRRTTPSSGPEIKTLEEEEHTETSGFTGLLPAQNILLLLHFVFLHTLQCNFPVWN